jgi:hypothetical protein
MPAAAGPIIYRLFFTVCRLPGLSKNDLVILANPTSAL